MNAIFKKNAPYRVIPSRRGIYGYAIPTAVAAAFAIVIFAPAHSILWCLLYLFLILVCVPCHRKRAEHKPLDAAETERVVQIAQNTPAVRAWLIEASRKNLPLLCRDLTQARQEARITEAAALVEKEQHKMAQLWAQVRDMNK